MRTTNNPLRGNGRPILFWTLPLFLLLLFILPDFSSATVGKPLLVYSEDETASIQYSQYSVNSVSPYYTWSSSGDWDTGALAANTTNKQYWKMAKTHPKGNKKVVLSVESPSSGNPHLFASIWDESNWDDGDGTDASYNEVKDLGEIFTKDYRCFDAAYEQLSGKLMIVAGSPTANQIKYWTWDGNTQTWSSVSTYNFSVAMGNIRWIRLASKPWANEIALIAADNGTTAKGLIWNAGSSTWGNEDALTSSLTTTTQEGIGIEYMQGGGVGYAGRAVAVWAQGSGTGTMYGKIWDGSAWGGPYTKTLTTNSSPRWIRVKADPNSAVLYVGYEDSLNDIYVLGWYGSGWFNNANQITTVAYGNYTYHRPFDLIAETGSWGIDTVYTNAGHVLIVYADTTELKYSHCSGNGGTALACGLMSTVRNGSITYQAYWAQLERGANHRIHLAIHDTNDDLQTWSFDNSNWVFEATLSTNLERDTNHNHEVFALAPMASSEALFAYSNDEEGSYGQLYNSRYNNGGAWEVGLTTNRTTTGPQYWKVAKSHPDGSKQVVAFIEHNLGGSWPANLYATIYDGSNYTTPWGTLKSFGPIYSYGSNGTENYKDYTRTFDVAYEQSSGHILVVASTGTQIAYWHYDGSSWSSSTYSPSGISNHTINWVKLSSNPGSDEIALIISAERISPPPYSNTAVGLIWNGSAWGNDQVLATDKFYYTSGLVPKEAISVEYMQAGTNAGKALFAWGQYNPIEIYGRVWNGSSWDTATSKAASGVIRWLRLAADPASDTMMAAFENDSKQIYALKWTGSGWESSNPTEMTMTNAPNSLYACGDANYNRPFDVSFESGNGHTGHALIAFGGPEGGGGKVIYYRHYNGSSWGIPRSSGSDTAYWVQLTRAPDNNIHMATHVVADPPANDRPVLLMWDNAAWFYKRDLDYISLSLERGFIDDGGGPVEVRYPEVIASTAVLTNAPEIHGLSHNWGTSNASITIYGTGFGNTQGSSTVKFYNNQTTTATYWSDTKVVVTVPAAATTGYIILTRGSNSDYISFTKITGAPTIVSILPNNSSNYSDVDMSYITGTNFSPTMTLKLKKSGESDITATNVTFASSSRIETATFDIKGVTTGWYSLEITNPDGQSVTSTDAFQVHTPGPITQTADQADTSGVSHPNQRHIVRDSAGTWFAVFPNGNPGEVEKIYITRSTDGLTWDPLTTLVSYGVGGGGLITTPSKVQTLSVDIYRDPNRIQANDRLHVVWHGMGDSEYSGNEYIHYTKCNDLANYNLAASWTQVDGGTTADTGLLTIDVDAGSGALTRSSGSFITDGIARGDSIVLSGFTKAGNNTTKIVQSIESAGTVIVLTNNSGLEDETGDGNERVQSGHRYDNVYYVYTSYYLGQPDIAVDSQGYPHVVWYIRQGDYRQSGSIYYTTSRTGSGNPKDWNGTPRTVAGYVDSSLGAVIGGASIDTDSNDYVHVAWAQAGSPAYKVRYAKSVEYTYFKTSTIIVTNKPGDGNIPAFQNPSLVVDSNNEIHVIAQEKATEITSDGIGNDDAYCGIHSGWARLAVNATAGTITRTGGDFTANGFKAGDQITILGFIKPGNNTTKIIQSVDQLTITVTDKSGLVNEADSGVANKFIQGPDGGEVCTRDLWWAYHTGSSADADAGPIKIDVNAAAGTFTRPVGSGSFLYMSDTGLTKINVNAGAGTFTRTAGSYLISADTGSFGKCISIVANDGTFTLANQESFLSLGFQAGDRIVTSGFTGGNNTTKIIKTIGGYYNDVITVFDKSGLQDENYCGDPPTGGDERIQAITGMAVGDTIVTSGFTNGGNNTTKIIQSVTDTVITVTDKTGLVNETGNWDERVRVPGFAAGDGIVISGFDKPENNTTKIIQSVTDTVITVTDNSGLISETGTENERIQSTWTKTSQNLTNGIVMVESPVVGAKMGTGIRDHVIVTKEYDPSAQKRILYWRWTNATKTWSLYSKTVDTGNESYGYMTLEKHAPILMTSLGYLFYKPPASPDYIYHNEISGLGAGAMGGATVVKLVSFTARGKENQINVEWETKTEIDNAGFNLYRSEWKDGNYVKLNDRLIPGKISSFSGQKYSFMDANVAKGRIYYYKLEDIDLKAVRTMHGPICVDWDGDGISDDEDPNPAIPEPVTPPSPAPGPNPSPTPDPEDEDNNSATKYGPTQVRMADMKALMTQEGVLLEWRTAHEVNNLGFHIYREWSGELLRLTPGIIAGSALMAGPGTALTAGHSYAWLDATVLNPLAPAKYWIEEIDLSGKKTVYGPIRIENTSSITATKQKQAKLLSEVAQRLDERYAEFWRVKELKDRIGSGLLKVDPSMEAPEEAAESLDDAEDLNLASVNPTPPTAQDKAQQKLLAKGPALKILVNQEGWYLITQPELLAAGLPPRVNPLYLQLFVDGREQSMRVNGGEDGSFDAGDSIEFYGTGLDTPSTDTRVYWLVVGSVPGKRISTVKGQGAEWAQPSFWFNVERRDRLYYVAAILNGEKENFFGDVVTSDPVDQLLTVSDMASSPPKGALLEIALQGYTAVPHRIEVSLNGRVLGKISFGGQVRHRKQFIVPHARLLEGDNLVTLVALQGELDIVFVKSIKLEYWRSRLAQEDSLTFPIAGGKQTRVKGFSNPNIRVLDITHPRRTSEVSGEVKPLPDGTYAVTFTAPESGPRRVMAFTQDKVKSPAAIVVNEPSNWYQSSGYDMVIISHRDFMTSLDPLKALRESQGLSVALVNVEDIYDEYGFGAKSPQAIKDFLKYAKDHWATAPRFVLLVGDATFDPRNFQAMGDYDLVPTKLLDTTYLETASDDWFVDFNEDRLPEMAIGRLPVRAPDEADTVVSKIVAYEQLAGGLDEVLLISDKAEGGDYDFEKATEEIEALLPFDVTGTKIFRGGCANDVETKAAILDGINGGPLLVNYAGHGSLGIWRGNPSVLTTYDPPSLTNGSKLPFFINMTCLNGAFHDIYESSLTEALLNAAGGGAVAVWSSSGLTVPESQHVLDKAIIKLLFNGEGLTIGEAAARAKASVTDDDDIRKTWNLFGDPAMRLKH
jgi:hypothetical protein